MGRLIMERNNLLNIPPYNPADGYLILPYRPGDEAHWLEIHKDADQYSDVTDDLFVNEFGSDVHEFSRRQLYLHHGNEVVGTASAWYDLDYKDGAYGMVHWIAIKRAHQGLGLSKPLMSEVCVRLADLGHKKACLTTSQQRLVAIHLYKTFGFEIVPGGR